MLPPLEIDYVIQVWSLVAFASFLSYVICSLLSIFKCPYETKRTVLMCVFFSVNLMGSRNRKTHLKTLMWASLTGQLLDPKVPETKYKVTTQEMDSFPERRLKRRRLAAVGEVELFTEPISQ